jgi:hypothetical protein
MDTEQRFIWLTVLEAGKSENMVPVSARHLKVFLLHHNVAEGITGETASVPAQVSLPLLKESLMMSWGPTLSTSSNPNYLPKAPPPNPLKYGN